MDTLYTGEIPKNFKYADFGSNYIDLYPNATNTGSVEYYRVFMYDNYFAFTHGLRNFNYQSYTYPEINVTDNILYRRDIDSIFVMCFIAIFGIVVLLNVFTSFYRKGGIFGDVI